MGPRQGNAHLTSSTTALLNITGRPVFTFTVTFTFVGGQISLGRPIPLGGFLQHVRVNLGKGSATMKKCPA
jgi:hypothetical protein